MQGNPTAGAARLPERTMPVPPGALERLPKWLICIPLALQWLYLALRYGSASLPSCANPAITAGGLVGEGKLEYFVAMGATARHATARHCAISTHRIASPAELLQMMHDAALVFPVIAKPDLGLCGFGVRKIDDLAALQRYVAAFPPNETVVLQEYLAQDGEASIFYARHPGAEKGDIIGLALRHFPQVTGDGRRSVAELISADVRAGRLLGSTQHECVADMRAVPPAGKTVRLSTIGSTRVGGLYRDGRDCITAQLTQVIDAIARDMPAFHFGRFDVRFDSLAALARGRGFKIMEINGAGSEAIQAWDPTIGLFEGFRIIFTKQHRLFDIGAAMRATGVKPIGVRTLFMLNRRQQRLIAQYPPSN